MSTATGTGWIGTTFDSLRNPGYRTLWIGSMLAFVAFFMSTIAQGVVAYDLEGDNSAVGAVVFGQGLAMLFLAPFGGALADRLPKRMLVTLCQAVIGAVFFVLAALIAADAISILLLAAGSFVIGTMFSLLGPARQAYVGFLVEPEKRGNAVALQQVALNTGRVAGPFLASALLPIAFIGSSGTYVAMGLMYVAALVTLATLPSAPGRSHGDGGGVFDDVLGGWRYVAGHARLRALILQFVLVMLAGFPFITVMPSFVDSSLDASTAVYGTLMGVMAIGGLAASLAVASLADSPRAQQVLTLGGLGFGASLLLTGIAPGVIVASGTMFLVGLASGAFQTLNNAIIVKEAETEYYGRVMSLTMMAFALFGVVALPVGVFADMAGERTTLIIMGAATCAMTFLLASWTSRVLTATPARTPERVFERV